MSYHNLLIYSTLNEQFGCYQFGAITNSASTNACMCLSVHVGVDFCQGYS